MEYNKIGAEFTVQDLAPQPYQLPQSLLQQD
jgi:hypothetical protein